MRTLLAVCFLLFCIITIFSTIVPQNNESSIILLNERIKIIELEISNQNKINSAIVQTLVDLGNDNITLSNKINSVEQDIYDSKKKHFL